MIGENDSENNAQHKGSNKIKIGEEARSSSSKNASLSYNDKNGGQDLEETISENIAGIETETDAIERQGVTSFVNLGASSSAEKHASQDGVDEGEMVSGELMDIINKTENTQHNSIGPTAKPFINTFVNIGSKYSPGLENIKTTLKPLKNTKSRSSTTQPGATKLLILPTEEEEQEEKHKNYNSANITGFHHLADFELAHDLQHNYFGEFMNNIRSHIRYSTPLTTQFYSFSTRSSTQPSTSRSITTTTSMDYISATTSYDLEIPADDVETFSADEKTGLFQMIEDGKNLLKSVLSNYFSTFITAIQSIWCNLVQNISELFQSFVSKNTQYYLEETAKMFKC